MFYLCYVSFCSSLPPVVCRRAHVLFMLFMYVLFVFTSVVCRRAHVLFMLFVSVCLYLQLFVGGLMFYLCYLTFCLSLPPVVCRRAHVLFMLFGSFCLSTSSCL